MTGPADGRHIKDADSLEVAPGFEHEKLEGWVPELAGEAEVRAGAGKGIRLPRRRDHYAQRRKQGRGLHL